LLEINEWFLQLRTINFFYEKPEKAMSALYFRSELTNQWGWILVRGIAAVVFGVLAFVWPEPALIALTLVWGIYALTDGALALIAAFSIRINGKPVWSLAVVGVLGVAVGVMTFVWPGLTALTLLMMIAVWALFMGAFQIVAAIRIRELIDHEWFLALSGVLSVLFGGMLIFNPDAGARAVVWLIGGYAVLFGVLLIVLGFQFRRITKTQFA
jgi:uncharacterized membrane protein HdeD (DUF308 family)